MQIEYDPALVEQAVRLAARRSRADERALHAAIDPLYGMADADERDRAFAAAFGRCFHDLGLDALIPRLLSERPLIAAACARCVVCEAARRSAESAELYVRGEERQAGPADRTLVVQLTAGSLVSPEGVTPLLRRELLHVHDMLDPAFGYAAADLAALSRGEQVVRDRYRVLWAIAVERRLAAAGAVGEESAAGLRRLFDRAFTVEGRAPADADFAAALGIASADHERLLSIARRPERLRECGERVAEERKRASCVA